MVAPLWVCQSVSCNQQRRLRRTVHGLYKSYTGLEARVYSRTANHRRVLRAMWAPKTDCDWTAIGPQTTFFVTDGQKRDYLSRASQCAWGATKNKIKYSKQSILVCSQPHRYRNSHVSVMNHPAEVTLLLLPQPIKAGNQFIDLDEMQGWIDQVGLVTYQSDVPAHSSTKLGSTQSILDDATNDATTVPNRQTKVKVWQRHLSAAEPARMCETTRGRQTLRSAVMPPRRTNPNEQPTSSRCIAIRLHFATIGDRFCTECNTNVSPTYFPTYRLSSVVISRHCEHCKQGKARVVPTHVFDTAWSVCLSAWCSHRWTTEDCGCWLQQNDVKKTPLNQPACFCWERSASHTTDSNASAVLTGRKKSKEYLI